ncbi:zinc finger protein 236-like isoform X3 [Dreissena polymorpha]|uniref:zinc finger protein 236-like isoform X3 n=1 Tax=Dreissena polymorpha TaxID=45954 RepID=UPI002263D245|nr:zinc finger protein 236-like isoform X3 [Dreissena polymorpha]
MPSSSRRKQAKPQHLSNGEKDGNQSMDTNEPETGYQSKPLDMSSNEEPVSEGQNLARRNSLGSRCSEGDEQGHPNVASPESADMPSAVYDLSTKVDNRNITNKIKDRPHDLEDHLCNENSESFSSVRELRAHTVDHPGAGTASPHSSPSSSHQNSNKHQIDLDNDSPPPKLLINSITTSGPSHHRRSSSGFHDNDLDDSSNHGLAKKRSRMDPCGPVSQHFGNSAIGIHAGGAMDLGYGLTGMEDGLEGHCCPICVKIFPKPSDLKRHMMCHTGEKPFRCQYCCKPFRAKSSMHYHLKASHGIDIELSPGLEERYLRMKTRAQLNLTYRNSHATRLPHNYGSEFHRDADNYDTDDYSNDSLYQTSGIGSDIAGSDYPSQGFADGQTSTDNRHALDLSVTGKFKNSTIKPKGKVGEIVAYADSQSKPLSLFVKAEKVIVSKLYGTDITTGKNTSVYHCNLCSNIFVSFVKLQLHLSVHFVKQVFTYQCCFCEDVFHQKWQMQNHLRHNHSYDVSGYKSLFAKDTLRAINPSESTDHFPCRFCYKIFTSQSSLQRHTKLHLRSRNCFCRFCGKTFDRYTSLQRHITLFHSKTASKSKTTSSSWVGRKMNFFISPRRLNPPPKINVPRNLPLNLSTSVKGSLQSFEAHRELSLSPPPFENGDTEDLALSQKSSDDDWSESLSEIPPNDLDDDSSEDIRSAHRHHLLPACHESSPRSHASWRPLSTSTMSTADQDAPLNFTTKSSTNLQDTNNNESSRSNSAQQSPELRLPSSNATPESLLPGYALGLNSANHYLMAKALMAHQTLTQHLNNTSPSMGIFPPNRLPPSLAAMSQMMSLPVGTSLLGDRSSLLGDRSSLLGDPHQGTSKSPSPTSGSSSKSETSPEDREGVPEGVQERDLMGLSRGAWGQEKMGPLWAFNMFSPDTGNTDGRKVTSLSRTHSRLGIVNTPINREALCKPTTLTDGRIVFKCPFCSKEFVSFSDINRHMDFHEDIRPYKCQYCDYYARTNSQLKVHMMRHQGIREFCCKLCNYKGVTQSDLNRHMKSQIHMLKSRNACKYCGEGFVTNKNLEKHLDGNCIVKMQKLNGGLDLPLHGRVT